mmetsp:Transcript_6094/g.7101  ORF Transcript_6094/g.7101 Transcript_6094/m.7101 type:complete len:102 (-) Transcript_6094:107-412(-)
MVRRGLKRKKQLDLICQDYITERKKVRTLKLNLYNKEENAVRNGTRDILPTENNTITIYLYPPQLAVAVEAVVVLRPFIFSMYLSHTHTHTVTVSEQINKG